MTYEMTAFKILVKYVICHDTDAIIVFKVTVEPIGTEFHISAVREEYMDSMCTIIWVFYMIDPNVQVNLTWILDCSTYGGAF